MKINLNNKTVIMVISFLIFLMFLVFFSVLGHIIGYSYYSAIAQIYYIVSYILDLYFSIIIFDYITKFNVRYNNIQKREKILLIKYLSIYSLVIIIYGYFTLNLEQKLFSNELVWAISSALQNPKYSLIYNLLMSFIVPKLEIEFFYKRLYTYLGFIRAALFYSIIEMLGGLNILIMLYQFAINFVFYSILIYFYRKINNFDYLLIPFYLYGIYEIIFTYFL
ncbi:hypothetical protein AB1303_13650 [Saccharolobus solfataricus]